MQRWFSSLIFILALLVTPVLPASAYEAFTTYRIAGNEITAVSLEEPEVEDPMVLVLTLTPQDDRQRQLSFESDGDLEDCKTQIDHMIGSKTDYVEIVSHINAQTMNGTIVIQCTVFHGLFGYNSD